MADPVNTSEDPQEQELKNAVGATPGKEKPETVDPKPADNSVEMVQAAAKDDEESKRRRLQEQQERDAQMLQQSTEQGSGKPADDKPADKPDAMQPQQTAEAPKNDKPKAPDDDVKPEKPSRFIHVDRESLDVLQKNKHWGHGINLSADMADLLREQKPITRTVTPLLAYQGIKFHLKNDRKVAWYPQLGQARGEFIGRSRFAKFDETDAKAIVALAQMRGWQSMNVHGSVKQKDMMWLEAQRAGMPVRNYTASPEVMEQWQKEDAERRQKEADNRLAGANPGEDGVIALKEEEKKALDNSPGEINGVDAEADVDAKAPEGEKPQTPESETPAAPEGETPVTPEGETPVTPESETPVTLETAVQTPEGETPIVPETPETPETPDVAQEEPAVLDENKVVGATEAQSISRIAAMKKPEPADTGPHGDESFEEYVDRKLNSPDTTPEIKQGWQAIKDELRSGTIVSESLDMNDLMREKTNGLGLAQEASVIRKVLSDNVKNPLVNDAAVKTDINTAKGPESKAPESKGIDGMTPGHIAVHVKETDDEKVVVRTQRKIPPSSNSM
ncbi:MAG: hypothetical protein GC185_09725 [Alphaproteobacteria bacterium]|nr:hypothetical protein [Alphaproteobacteria bacterium]